MLLRLCLLLVTLATASSALAAAPCGGDVPCQVNGGDYRIELPKDGDTRGVFVFFHGYKSSAKAQMKHRQLIDMAHAHHLAFVAIDGVNGNWSFPNSPGKGRNETRFIAAVLYDLDQKFGFTANNTVIGGFSIGASMAWYTACQQGDRVAGMVTFSGVFWDPLPSPEDCVTKLPPMVHFHGTADRTFPLEGRAIGPNNRQGNTYESVAIYRERAECDMNEAHKTMLDGIECDVAPCLRGNSALCIHGGGHTVRDDLLGAGLTTIGFPE